MSRLAVVIPTRNRGDQAAHAVRAVLQDPTEFELVVVDQSSDDSTELAMKGVSDARLRVVRSELRGASNARNLGVSLTSAPVIAFTDDDCRPEPGWASSVLRVFEEDPEAALVFGRVYLPPKGDGDYAASFEPQVRVQEGIPLPDGDLGIGANFAIRRKALQQLGGFDPLLGPGAPVFRGAEETDLLIRALHARYRVVNASECNVLHLGIRSGADVRPLHVAYQFAVGAAFGKHARLSGLAGVRDAARWVEYYVRLAADDAIKMQKPRASVLAYFLTGALATFRYSVDPETQAFRSRR